MNHAKVTIIDDRTREFIEKRCPFIGEAGRCNVDQAAQPRCVGLDHEYCILQQYDRFVVQRHGAHDRATCRCRYCEFDRERGATDEELAQEARDWAEGRLEPKDWDDAPEAVIRAGAAKAHAIFAELKELLADLPKEKERRVFDIIAMIMRAHMPK
jgi:hypothetical protein